jgi:hypothetical protein
MADEETSPLRLCICSILKEGDPALVGPALIAGALLEVAGATKSAAASIATPLADVALQLYGIRKHGLALPTNGASKPHPTAVVTDDPPAASH